ncbi:MAG: hypothetical protein HQ479_10180 [Rhodobacter sp.]|nr:hypothetical protein [Rhodobacter sp.]
MTDRKQEKLLVLAEPKKKNFWADESGSVTTDQVVLMGAVVGIALLAVGNFATGAEFLANDRKEVLSSYQGMSSDATSPSYTDVSSTSTDDSDPEIDTTSSSAPTSGGSSSSAGSSTYTSSTGSSTYNSSTGSSTYTNDTGSTTYTNNSGTSTYTPQSGSSYGMNVLDPASDSAVAALGDYDYLLGGGREDVNFG